MINDKESIKLVIKLLATLPEQERKVMGERMGLTGNKPKTRDEVLKMFAISQARFEQIEAKVIELFKHKDDSLNMGKMYPERRFRLGDLSDRERKIIQERLGVAGGVAKSRKEVCKFFAISDERLRQIEEKAKKILSQEEVPPIFPPYE